MENHVDINETKIFEHYPDVLATLLKDHTTGRNLFWATDSYAHLGTGFQYDDEITVDHIIGENGKVICPRVLKDKGVQTGRTKDMAEVFTPSWVCNAQNNIVDDAWFGRSNVFNTADDTYHTWISNPQRITFPAKKTWKSYVRATRMEITCGEAPYLVSRYDTTTGNFIALEQRIGMLDRKLRIVSENTQTSGEWLSMAQESYKNIYGYEWQGDNLVLARESLLVSFIEYYRHKFGKDPQLKSLYSIANIISWNIWQMDGLKCVVPNSCGIKPSVQQSLFGESEMVSCEGCRCGDIHRHNGIYCLIKDWDNNEIIPFVSLIKRNK